LIKSFLVGSMRRRIASFIVRVFNPKRTLHLHEYQSKDLMNAFGVNTQKFIVVATGKEAVNRASQLRINIYGDVLVDQ